MGRPRKNFDSSTGEITSEGKGRYSFKLGFPTSDRIADELVHRFERTEGKIFYKDPYPVTLANMALTGKDKEIYEDMGRAVAYYQGDPLVGQTIDLMVALSNDGFRNVSKDKSVTQKYNQWCEDVNMEEVREWMFREIYRSANCVSYRTFSEYAPEDGREKTKFGKIPTSYTVLNPMLIRPGDSIGVSQRELWMKIENKNEFEKMKANPDLFSDLFHLEDDRFVIDNDFVKLNAENVRRILRGAQPYERFGVPLSKRATPDLHLKSKMKEMDLSAINGTINYILLVTIGSDEHPATLNQIRRVAKMLQNSSQSLSLVYNHTMKIEVIRPTETPQILDAAKYTAPNREIRGAFGVSEVLSGGQGGSNNLLSIKSFLANLLDGQKKILRFTRDQYRDLQKVWKDEIVPTPTFTSLTLSDEVREKQVLALMASGGLISYQTFQLMTGLDPEVELANKKEEDAWIKKGLYKPPGATGVSGDQPGGRPVGKGGDYAARQPGDQKRLKGKASEEEVLLELSLTRKDLQENKLETVGQLKEFVHEQFVDKYETILAKI